MNLQLVVIAAFALLGTGAHAQAPEDFAWRVPLATPAGAAHYRVELPATVYQRVLRSDEGDLRVFNGEGSAVPLAFLPPPEATRVAVDAVDLPLLPLRVDSPRRDLGDLRIGLRNDAAGTTVDITTGNGVALHGARLAGYLVDASQQAAPLVALSLSLATGSDVATRVRVDGSDDLAVWRPLAASAPLLQAQTAHRRLARERVPLAGVPAKYLRITFLPGEPPTELIGARGEFADHIVDAPRQWRDVAGVAYVDHPGEFEFDLGGQFPVDRIALRLPEINSVVPAHVFVRASAKDEWREVGATVFYRLQRDAGEAVAAPLAVPTTLQRYWKVSVDERSGGLGATPPTLSAGWLPRTVVFAARGTGPFVLAYGSARASPVALPIETLVPGYDRRTSPATFGVAAVGTSDVAPALAALHAPIDRKRWLLWATLALATGVLGYMAWRLSRDMRAAPPDAGRASGDDAGADVGASSAAMAPPDAAGRGPSA